jgi:outer membrane protein OmpA-like peptidoglycan-associated protein
VGLPALASPPAEAEPSEPPPEAGALDQPIDGEAEARVLASLQPEPAEEPAPRRVKWLHRWAPTHNYGEIGVFGGLLYFAADHELFDSRAERADFGWLPLRRPNLDVGVRAGYYPLRFVGVEAEGAFVPIRIDERGSGLAYALRGHVVGQLGLWSVTPFVLVGGGLIGVRSPDALLGRDIDPVLDFGGGVKVHFDRVLLRLDVRDVITHQRGVDAAFRSHNLELLLGVGVVLGRKRERERDAAPQPWQPAPGPELIGDSDGDGIYDDRDACVEQPGVAPDGCPPPDSDGDGLLDAVDTCIDQPETRNGYEDDDGCPDALPAELARFEGHIAGITFETGKATIKRSSLPVLDEAVRVLSAHPSVRIEIAGHTDDVGEPARNLELSRARAGSVASYLEGMGIAAERMTTVGHGHTQPIADNATKQGRAQNRRIEFRILVDEGAAVSTSPVVEPR